MFQYEIYFLWTNPVRYWYIVYIFYELFVDGLW
jgi:hypothetical protein